MKKGHIPSCVETGALAASLEEFNVKLKQCLTHLNMHALLLLQHIPLCTLCLGRMCESRGRCKAHALCIVADPESCLACITYPC